VDAGSTDAAAARRPEIRQRGRGCSCIVGNGHMLMLEDNSDAVAGLILRWLEGRMAAG